MDSGRQAYTDDDLALDLGGLLRAIARGLRWLLPLIMVVCLCLFIGLLMVAPKYRGEARILIESTDIQLPGEPRGVEGERALLDSEGVESQVQLLRSTDLARRVINKLNLAAVSEFGGHSQGSLLNGLMSMIAPDEGRNGNSAEERVLKHFYKNLDVYRLEGSRVIAIDYSSQDPVLSANVANTIVDEYLALQSNAKRETTELTSAALEPQIVELRKEVQVAQQAVADFRARADLLVGANNIPLNQQQLADTSSDYSAAQATKAEAQAKADLIRELLNSGGSLETASDVLNSQLIQRLRERQVAIQSNIAELSITLLPNHPQLKALQSQLEDYNLQIRSEARKILQGLENDAKVASQQALALENRLEDLKTLAAKSNQDQARLSELEREANAKSAQLDQLLLSFQEADSRLRAQILPADARIISQATVPSEPYAPRIFVSLVIAALVTFILGAAVIIMRELLSGAAIYRPNATTAGPLSKLQGRDSNLSRVAEIFDDGSGGDMAPPPPAPKPASSFSPEEARDLVFPEHANSEVANEKEPTERLGPTKRHKSRKHQGYDQNVSPIWVGNERAKRSEPELDRAPLPKSKDVPDSAAKTAADIAATGKIVVLSVDDKGLSHDLAFTLARKAANNGRSSVFLEVFPEQSNSGAAEGFSDIVAGRAPFAKVVYRDAGSKAHIIESGKFEITDDMVASDRFKSALDAIQSTYETVVVDLGAIDGTLASARLLGFADRVLIAASAPDQNHELESAANLLAHNTGADVEIVIAGGNGPGPRRNGDGHAA